MASLIRNYIHKNPLKVRGSEVLREGFDQIFIAEKSRTPGLNS